jgi:hypothetical protein
MTGRQSAANCRHELGGLPTAFPRLPEPMVEPGDDGLVDAVTWPGHEGGDGIPQSTGIALGGELDGCLKTVIDGRLRRGIMTLGSGTALPMLPLAPTSLFCSALSIRLTHSGTPLRPMGSLSAGRDEHADTGRRSFSRRRCRARHRREAPPPTERNTRPRNHVSERYET